MMDACVHTKEKYEKKKLHITRVYEEYDGYISKSKILFRVVAALQLRQSVLKNYIVYCYVI
jgi:hypothetical protein